MFNQTYEKAYKTCVLYINRNKSYNPLITTMPPKKAAITLTERFDYAALRYILENLHEYKTALDKNDDDLIVVGTLLHKYIASAKQDGTINVE